MLAILQPFCPSMMVGTIRPLISDAGGEKDKLTAAVAAAKVEAAAWFHLVGIVTEPAAKQVIFDMLHSGVPESVARSIFETGYYEIVVPPKATSAPYIAITYTNDVEEGHTHDLNSQPAQDTIFLTIPKPGMTAVERGEWEEEEEVWDGFRWGSVECRQESGEVDAIPWPVLYTIAEFEDLEPVSGLQIYFTECDDSSLDPFASTVDRGVEPWYSSKSHSSLEHVDVRTQEWSDDYELGDLRNLVVVDEDAVLERDFSVSTNSDSDLESF
ncbi:hypothetical protein V565_049700 [Rhizoctonia solani 123E]|uniref:Uncharacterized protein n=1 Tax=Rhizoctonia solani 123E TaxID=1423351 RepID=A0A074RYJ4_9AGAM|nr:hypothetical protein V565_049700 [Rhizoctonia solani 123E]